MSDKGSKYVSEVAAFDKLSRGWKMWVAVFFMATGLFLVLGACCHVTMWPDWFIVAMAVGILASVPIPFFRLWRRGPEREVMEVQKSYVAVCDAALALTSLPDIKNVWKQLGKEPGEVHALYQSLRNHAESLGVDYPFEVKLKQ